MAHATETGIGTRSGGVVARLLVPLALFVLAVGVRALPWRSVLLDDRVQPYGNDAFYHLRRIVYSLVRFPEVLEFDPYVNFPGGAKPIWTPYFDWVLAALARPFVSQQEPLQLERLMMWVPPLLGGATVVALYFLARRYFGTHVAVLAGGLLAVMSGHFWYSQIGFLDHHVAVAFLSTLVLAAGMDCLDRHGRRPAGTAPVASVVTGVVLASALLLWPGSLLHVFLADSALGLYLLTRPDREGARSFALRFGLIHAVGFAILLPLCAPNVWPQWSRMSPVVLTGFQPWLFGVLAAIGFGGGVLWRGRRLGASRERRVQSLLGLSLLLLTASAVLIPPLRESATDAWQWLAKEDEFQGNVAESAPLFFHGEKLVLFVALVRFSGFVFFVPAAIAGGVWAVWRERFRAPLLLFLWWTAGMFAVTLLQRRFFNSASIPVSLLMAWSVIGLRRMLPPHLVRTAGRRLAANALVGLLLLLLVWPMLLATYQTYVRNLLRADVDGRVEIHSQMARRVLMVEMSRWLGNNSPRQKSWLDAEAKPEWGVLGPWPIGHVMKYEGRLPTVVDNFGDDNGPENYRLARQYTESREPAAIGILEQLRVRYVVAQGQHAYLGGRPRPDSMFFSLYHHDGTAFEPQGATDLAPFPALSHHRLVYESRSLKLGTTDEPAEFKIFERVEGAWVVGLAAPGSVVEVSVGLRTNRKRPIEYRATATADAKGRYELRLPYANQGSPPSVRVAPAYVVRSGEKADFLVIPDADVRSGARVGGPDLRP